MSLLSRFRKNERGNIAILFGLAVTPAIMGMGLAVDYTRVSNARTELQAAVDAAAVAAAKAAGNMNDDEFEKYTDAFFKQNLGQPSFEFGSFKVERDEKAVVAKGEGTLPTALMAIVPGYETLPVKAEARVEWKSTKIEVAMVLDTTGSMKGNKIAEMRKAAKGLVDILASNEYTTDAARIAVVPFNAQVRIDTKYRNSDWLYAELNDPAYQNRPQYQDAAYQATTRSAWRGCLSNRERAGNYDATIKKASSSSLRQTGHWASTCESNSATITPLTNDFGRLKQDIGSLPAVGATNITLGVSWGLMTLSDEGIFANAAPASREVEKFMIVLTDGDNTVDRVTKYAEPHLPGGTARINDMNQRTALACSTAKSEGIKIYTIRVINGDADLLRNCATDDSKYYDVQNAAELDGVFRNIAMEIGNIRLTN
ncbi:VWA domain-containing protein [Agaricicola taiwanensis]|uniref:VWA domain-containing protein n=1 Tax=Agaricicola taiwanensis TaxID=591372 RepID=A0A8J2VUU6_9RHOB|nr:VWA domain-containing protein [Agaricicola taiwanensis]GGE40839.1 VWA domain-containing protein [Agaricicola taiwanensis]